MQNTARHWVGRLAPFSLLLLLPCSALAQSNAEWLQYKAKCGIPASTAYNDWVIAGSPCPKSNASGNASVPSGSALTPQEQVGAAIGQAVMPLLQQGIHNFLFGSPTTPPVTAPLDPAEEQRQLAAQQLNNSGIYLLKQKNYAGAINEFQKALAIVPNDANVLHNLTIAKQQLKNTAVAGQTSGTLGQLLGTNAAGSIPSAVDPPESALSSIDLNSDPNVVDLRGTTKTAVAPESLKGQLDAVLGNNALASPKPNSQVVQPQDKDMELLSILSQPGTSQTKVVQPQEKDEELLSTLSQPATSGKSNVTPAAIGSKAMPAVGASPKNAPNDNANAASSGTGKCAFGTTCNPTNPDLSPSAAAPPVAVQGAPSQANSGVNSGATAIGNTRNEGAKAASNCAFDTTGCAPSMPAIPRNKADAQALAARGSLQIPPSTANAPEVRPADYQDSVAVIKAMDTLAKRQGWSAEKLARLDTALHKLGSDGDPNSTSVQVRAVWRDVLARGQDAGLVREASQGEGLGFPGAGTQTVNNDCTIFALANAAGLPYGAVAARATELIHQGDWRSADERANPQAVIERHGLNGGEVVMLSEGFGQAEVVPSSDFAKTLRAGRPVMINVIPADGNMQNGHEVVLTKTFQHGGETWFEMMDSNQGPQRRLFLSSRELNTMLQENGVAYRPDAGTTPKLIRNSGDS